MPLGLIELYGRGSYHHPRSAADADLGFTSVVPRHAVHIFLKGTDKR